MPDRPEVHRSPSVPFFLYPDVQWAFPRLREVVEDLQAFRPDIVHVATEFSLGIAGLKAARQLGLPIIASAHTDYDQYAARYGVHLGAAGRLALPPLVLRPGAPGALPVADLRGVGPSPRRAPTRASGAAASIHAVFSPGFRSDGIPGGVRPRARRPAGDLYRADRAGEESRPAARGLGDAGAGARGGQAGPGGARSAGGRDPAPRASRASTSPACCRVRRFRRPTRRPTSSPSRRPPRRSATRCWRRWARGCPRWWRRPAACSSSPTTAATPGWSSPTAPPAITDGLRRLLTDAALRRRLGAGALATARARDWDRVYDQLLEDYQAAIDAKGRARAA